MITKILHKESLKINCPQCKLETKDIWICQMDSVIGKRYAYLCGNCEKLLGISKNLISISSLPVSEIKFNPN
ncbi:MAG: hypothetical protein HXY48_08665 [Ignavibacteriaceae bacterium]|nr:hypothetical protein [Ignavibacteriaceae bacterium]